MPTKKPEPSPPRARRPRAVVTALLCALLGLLLLAAPALAVVPSTHDSLDVVNGWANAITRAGNTIYVGGNFSQIGPRTGPFVSLPPSSATYAPSSAPYDTGVAQVASGSVYAVAPDGAGGEYIGGYFSSVGGVALSNAAHILANGSVDPNWAPNPDQVVRSIAVSGNTVYLGGSFTHVENANGTGTVARSDAAAVDAVHGYDLGWNPNANGTVMAVAVDGPVVYLGGYFTTVENATGTGTDTRNYAAAVDAATGNEDAAWNPNLNGEVNALAVSGSSVYLGGSFTTVNGSVARGHAAAVDATSGVALAWNPSPDGTVNAIAPGSGVVYVGGSFSNVTSSTGTGTDTRIDLAAVDPTSGDDVASWRPSVGNTVNSISVSSNAVYVGGAFTSVESHNAAGGVKRPYLAALDLTNGWDTGWNPSPGNTVYAVVADGSRVLAGGAFDLANGQQRSNAAALDAASGQPTGWNPSPDGFVNSIAVSGGTVYLGGAFSNVENSTGTGTVGRPYAAAVDATNGYDTGWNPSPSGDVYAIVVQGGVVYLGGHFTTIEGGTVTRGDAAAVDASTAAPTGWDPGANGDVRAILPSGGTIYLGGTFTSLGYGAAVRDAAGAVDATTGAAAAWNPSLNGTVTSLAASGSTVYLGGLFTTVNGSVARSYAAAVDATSGAATAWSPNPSAGVGSLAISDGSVYLEGNFRSIENATGTGTVSRIGLASVDTANGYDTGWNPGTGLYLLPAVITVQPNSIGALGHLAFADDGTLYAAGYLDGGFASFSVAPVNTSAPAISGTPAVGQTLTCSTGAWGGTTPQTYSYQWLRGGIILSGATGSTHVVATSDRGSTLTCAVTASNIRTSTTAWSASVAVPGPSSSPAPPAGPVPNSNFDLLHAPYVNTTTGAVGLYDEFYNPGRLTWHVWFHNGDVGVVTGAVAARRCPAYQVRLRGRCRPEWVLFGQGAMTVTAAGAWHWSVSPSAAARKALRIARHRHLGGLPVAVVATFQSAYGGAPATHAIRVLVPLHWH